MSNVWQISCGETGRTYDQLFLDHDVMLLGPGNPGRFTPETYEDHRRISQVRQFATEVSQGDLVLLRRVHRVVAIGVIDGQGYSWNDAFEDVHGWDLQHTHRVSWQTQLASELDRIQAERDLFSSRKQIPAFTRVNDQAVLDPIKSALQSCASRPLKDLPDFVPSELTMETLGRELFSHGLPNLAVDRVIEAITRQRRMLHWYEEHGGESDRPTEHEVVAHMILPFLLALGWSEQLVAVEWKKVDLAGFSATPTTSDRCVLVCEAKGYRDGLQNTLEQATGYVHDLELRGCRKILVTNGARLYLYEPDMNDAWALSGYANIRKLRRDHLIPRGKDAVATILALTPAQISQPLRCATR